MVRELFFNRNTFKRIIAAMMVVVLLVPGCFVYTALGDNQSDLEDTKNEQNENKKKIEEAQKKIEEIKAQTSDLSEIVQQLDAQMGELTQELADLNTRIEELETEIADTEVQLEEAEAAKEEQYEAMKLRIQFMYERNEYTYVEILLTSQSMAEMLNRYEYISQISQYDRNMLEEYQNTVTTIEESKTRLEADREELAASKESLESQKEALALVQEEKQSQLEALNASEASEQTYLSQLETYDKQLEQELASIEAKIAAEENSGKATTNSYDGGKFKWPTVSTRITSPYGDTDGRSSGHKGVDIGAVTVGVAGDAIYAAYDGEVVIAHLQSDYYSTAGNYVMIYHGDGLYTRYLHADSLLVSVGQTVTKGQKIALMGTTGNSTGVHLHFDVRLNGSYVNPMTYFN